MATSAGRGKPPGALLVQVAEYFTALVDKPPGGPILRMSPGVSPLQRKGASARGHQLEVTQCVVLPGVYLDGQ